MHKQIHAYNTITRTHTHTHNTKILIQIHTFKHALIKTYNYVHHYTRACLFSAFTYTSAH